MLIATFSAAAPLLAYSALGYIALGLAGWGLARLARRNGPLVRALCGLGGIGLVGAGIYGSIFVLIGLAAIGCPPDAYECPV